MGPNVPVPSKEGHNLVVVAARHGEDLGVDLAHDVARRGDLHHNHATVVVWQPVACRVQHVPSRTDERRRRKASRPVGWKKGEIGWLGSSASTGSIASGMSDVCSGSVQAIVPYVSSANSG